MRRFVAMLASVAVLATSGCGVKSYEVRLDKTLEQMRYRKRLDDNLMAAPEESKLKQFLIFVRPPKPLAGPAKDFLLAPPEEGKFDLAESFVEPGKSSLHVLARVAPPKGAPGKPAPPPPTNRGDFNNDVLALLAGVYNIELDPAQAKPETKRNNSFKRMTFEGNGKTVQLYLSGSKATPPEVALIFEYPKSEQSALVSKIDLTLGAYEVGERARRSYEGAVGDESAEETGDAGAAAAF